MLFSALMRQGYARLGRSFHERLFRLSGLDFTTPAFVQCVLTEKCNYKCKYCSHWRQEHYTDEISVADWKEALLSLKEFCSPLLIDFTGGEPTIYPHFLDIVEFCCSQGIDWVTTTNGSTLTRTKFVQQLVAARPLKIDISIDSASNDIHDDARGVPGSLSRISRGASALISERNRSGQNFPVRLKVTVHKLNAGSLVPIVRWAEAVGATSIDFNAVNGLWRKEDVECLSIVEPTDLLLLRDQVEELIVLKARGAPIETGEDGLRGMVAFFSRDLSSKINCRDPLRNFLINPRGDVRTCGCSPPIGNVRQQSARSIWRSEAAKQMRQKSLGCVLEVRAPNRTCTTHRTIFDDFRRAMLLLGVKA
ncbi:radical SAM protein [Bradyrhizobium sp. CB3481]|uniref:radical SAM protein n=1 Tax=Bradyrhizobium sp. CB3481 TaxID=3039158 RepID=UPI0024B0ED94|nr:radical SAM protein [Bradyrhizobium sp. CB3481]WFU18826.1 radical SAM protein [Bradyrhizobium sp. CB3481]